MNSALSVIAVFTIVAFLGGTAFGIFTTFVVSIHRTSRAPLSEIHQQRAGSLSRCVLTGIRTKDEEAGK